MHRRNVVGAWLGLVMAAVILAGCISEEEAQLRNHEVMAALPRLGDAVHLGERTWSHDFVYHYELIYATAWDAPTVEQFYVRELEARGWTVDEIDREFGPTLTLRRDDGRLLLRLLAGEGARNPEGGLFLRSEYPDVSAPAEGTTVFQLVVSH